MNRSQEEMIALLEHTTKMVESGELISIAIAGEQARNTAYGAYIATIEGDALTLLGCIRVLEQVISNEKVRVE